jgi:hypothetical protein
MKFNAYQKILLRALIGIIGFGVILFLLGRIQSGATDMMNGIVDDGRAKQEMMKDCQQQQKDSGLKNKEAMDFFHECTKDGFERIKASKNQ